MLRVGLLILGTHLTVDRTKKANDRKRNKQQQYFEIEVKLLTNSSQEKIIAFNPIRARRLRLVVTVY